MVFGWIRILELTAFLHRSLDKIARKVGMYSGKVYLAVTKYPGDFVTNVTQINSQSDLISMLSFAGPSYLTIRPYVCMILI